jgi:hypothetical protein
MEIERFSKYKCSSLFALTKYKRQRKQFIQIIFLCNLHFVKLSWSVCLRRLKVFAGTSALTDSSYVQITQ